MATKKNPTKVVEQQDYFKENLALQEKVKKLTDSLNSYKSANTRLKNLRKEDAKINDEKVKQLCEAVRTLQDERNKKADAANRLADNVASLEKENFHFKSQIKKLQEVQDAANKYYCNSANRIEALTNKMQLFNKLPWYKKARYKFD